MTVTRDVIILTLLFCKYVVLPVAAIWLLFTVKRIRDRQRIVEGKLDELAHIVNTRRS